VKASKELLVSETSISEDSWKKHASEHKVLVLVSLKRGNLQKVMAWGW
jgi:hypothetical protein